MALQVTIVDRHGELFSGDADYVAVPASAGSLGILPGRQPVLAALQPGKVHIRCCDGTEEYIEVGEGFASVDDDQVAVVVDRKLNS